MSSRPLSSARIMADLKEILASFNGREYSGTIGPETLFFADLGLASIDAVVLGERLQAHYGRPIPVSEVMAALGSRTDRRLRMGELADFLQRHLSAEVDSRGQHARATSTP